MYQSTHCDSRSCLADQVKAHIDDFIVKMDTLSFGKRDLQMLLAGYLQSAEYYDKIFLDYYVPRDFLPQSEDVWDTYFCSDIVLKKSNEYFLINLHYSIEEINRDLLRFGEMLPDSPVFTNRSDVDSVLYNTWQSVRRMELLKKRFAAVVGGWVLIMTNDDIFLKRPNRPGVYWDSFSLAPGQKIGGGRMDWSQKAGFNQKRPSFDLDNVYNISWQDRMIDNVKFHYTLIEV